MCCVCVALVDAMTVIAFLKTFGLEQHFKVHFCRTYLIAFCTVSR